MNHKERRSLYSAPEYSDPAFPHLFQNTWGDFRCFACDELVVLGGNMGYVKLTKIKRCASCRQKLLEKYYASDSYKKVVAEQERLLKEHREREAAYREDVNMTNLLYESSTPYNLEYQMNLLEKKLEPEIFEIVKNIVNILKKEEDD